MDRSVGLRAIPGIIDSEPSVYHYGIVRLIGQIILDRSLRKHRDAREWLALWVATVERADWSNIEEVRVDYPSADGVKLKSQVVVTIFKVKGNRYRLLTNINYDIQSVQVLELLTHAEYDREKWKGRY